MGKKATRTRPEPDREPRAQFAALPWRFAEGGGVEVLLITSRETRRWVIPKGWPIKGLKPAMTAAREAFEEAGVKGEIGKQPLGAFRYDKRLRSGRLQHVRVRVYLLLVTVEAETWPEKGQRDKLWTSAEAAAPMVDEPDLQRLIAAFAGR
ncbi:MAG: NUDIX hydrolase [Phenylobacterium sp.]